MATVHEDGMMGRLRMFLPVLLGFGLGAAAQPNQAPEQRLRVTTDDDAYCQVLLERVSAAPAAANGPAAQLMEEGRQLCRAGHPRTGIAKLRRALRVAMAAAQ
jgi:DNA-binding FrmR family transcriptional regulator